MNIINISFRNSFMLILKLLYNIRIIFYFFNIFLIYFFFKNFRNIFVGITKS